MSCSPRQSWPTISLAPLRSTTVESHSTLGTIWATLGMTGYWMGLLWLNILLSNFLTPLLIIPFTWIQDAVRKR